MTQRLIIATFLAYLLSSWTAQLTCKQILGTCRDGGVVPVRVTLKTDKALKGHLLVRSPDQGYMIRQELNVGKGHFVYDVAFPVANLKGPTLAISLHRGHTEVARHQIAVKKLMDQRPTVLTGWIGKTFPKKKLRFSPSELMPDLGEPERSKKGWGRFDTDLIQTRDIRDYRFLNEELMVAHLPEDEITNDWRMYANFDMLVVCKELQARQQKALVQWVRCGGHIVLTANVELGKLSVLPGQTIDCGLGKVAVVPALPDIRSRKQVASFLGRLPITHQLPTMFQYRWSCDMEDRFPELIPDPVSRMIIMSYLLLFILLVTVAERTGLHLLRAHTLTWVVTPAIVLFFCLGGRKISTLSRGTRNRHAVIDFELVGEDGTGVLCRQGRLVPASTNSVSQDLPQAILATQVVAVSGDRAEFTGAPWKPIDYQVVQPFLAAEKVSSKLTIENGEVTGYIQIFGVEPELIILESQEVSCRIGTRDASGKVRFRRPVKERPGGDFTLSPWRGWGDFVSPPPPNKNLRVPARREDVAILIYMVRNKKGSEQWIRIRKQPIPVKVVP